MIRSCTIVAVSRFSCSMKCHPFVWRDSQDLLLLEEEEEEEDEEGNDFRIFGP
jgi:hypothetical protein